MDELRATYFGDANLDGEFNSGDLVAVFATGEYEDEIPNNSTWATGDWDGDGEFGSGDFVLAFAAGGYEQGPRERAAVVPEPNGGIVMLTLSVWALFCVYGRSCPDRLPLRGARVPNRV